MSAAIETWPSLPYDEWAGTHRSLHMWTQIVGKVRLAQMPWINHSWQVPLYVTPRGLTTSAIPHGNHAFQIDFDLVDHRLLLASSDGHTGGLDLEPQTVADFYDHLMRLLVELDLPVSIDPVPSEVPDPTPFPEDQSEGDYDPDYARRFPMALVQAERVLTAFRARFVGKCSPVHFFWGGMDLAVTRFSGRPAPEHPGGIPNLPDEITREAYSEEVSSCGFWPGNADAPEPIFYAYAYPTPEGYADVPTEPDAAFWYGELGEFVLPYEVVRTSEDPDATLTAFLETTYAGAADLANWDRTKLERPAGWTPSTYMLAE